MRIEKYNLPVITGAPGSGKTRMIKELLKRESKFIFFDIDWLDENF